MTTINVRRDVLELHRFCATGNSRWNLQNILVDSHAAVATDGLRMAIVDLAAPPGLGGGEQHLIPFKLAKDALKADKKAEVFAVTWDAENVGISTPNVTLNAPRPDATFPDWERVVPCAAVAGDSRAPLWGINPRFVGDIAAYLKAVGYADAAVTLHAPKDALSPVLLTAFEYRFIIMPRRP